jgi:hypothetical protein
LPKESRDAGQVKQKKSKQTEGASMPTEKKRKQIIENIKKASIQLSDQLDSVVQSKKFPAEVFA